MVCDEGHFRSESHSSDEVPSREEPCEERDPQDVGPSDCASRRRTSRTAESLLSAVVASLSVDSGSV